MRMLLAFGKASMVLVGAVVVVTLIGLGTYFFTSRGAEDHSVLIAIILFLLALTGYFYFRS